jgi:hypothetical protein
MDPFDPSGSGQILAVVLTAAGVPVAGAIIAAITQALKSVPGLGGVVSAQPVVTVMIISAALIGYAVTALAVVLDAVSLFGLFLAWLAINGFSKATYDTVSGKAPLT